jgi:hypothetical protein
MHFAYHYKPEIVMTEKLQNVLDADDHALRRYARTMYRVCYEWHKRTGSYQYYCDAMCQQALADGAPADATYKNSDGVWRTLRDCRNANAVRGCMPTDQFSERRYGSVLMMDAEIHTDDNQHEVADDSGATPV